MNNRIVELLQRPQQIQLEDLALLEKQIQQTPYLQFVRALYLYGIHQYQPEDYKNTLTTTAAYTTDKKILFQFINQQSAKTEVVKKVEEHVSVNPVVAVEEVKEPVVENQEEVITSEEEIDEVVDVIEVVEEVIETENNNNDPEIAVKKPEYGGYKVSDNVTFSAPVVSTFTSSVGKTLPVQFESAEDQELIPIVKPEVKLQKEIANNFTEEIEDQEAIIEAPIEEEPLNEGLTEDQAPELSNIEEQEAIIDTPIEEVEESLNEGVTEDQAPEVPNIEEEEAIIETPTEEVEVSLNEIETEDQDQEISNIEEEITIEEALDNNEAETIITEPKDEVVATETAALSYEGIDDFLPNVKFEVPKNHHTFLNPPKFDKPKAQEIILPTPVKETESPEAINVTKEAPEEEVYNNTMDFGPFSDCTEEVSSSESIEVIVEEDKLEVPEPEIIIEESAAEIISTWKPMQLDSNTPDALIEKKVVEKIEQQVSLIKEDVKNEQVIVSNSIEDIVEPVAIEENSVTELPVEERPIMNVSFFADHVSDTSDKDNVENVTTEVEEELAIAEDKAVLPLNVDSNIGVFINTWQNWLNIDRRDVVTKVIEEKKTKAIEQFIENQPKISQLKEEVAFVIKEKNEDISHLMTETLVSLYVEQKLYSKAIKGYEILTTKYPEKVDYYKERIEEVKEMRKPF